MSSLKQWLMTGKLKTTPPTIPGLPDPGDCIDSREAVLFQTANDAVETICADSPPTTSKKRKQGEYNNFNEEQRAKIGRLAVEDGVARATRRFTADTGMKVSETTVRSIRNQYVRMRKASGDDNLTALPKSPRGNSLMLGYLDGEVQNWIRQVRLSGGVINLRIVMAGAEAIVAKFDRKKLARFGGHIEITKHLARSILRRMGFVKRKGTKAAKTLPSDFESIKCEFVKKVEKVVSEFSVPDSLVINWDQTGCQLVPGGEWTMEEKGSKQVSIAGIDDKRQITLLLGITKSGTLLPPQLIYAGKTEHCLPQKVKFPDDWDVTFTETHWSNELSMLRYIDNVILPYVNEIREELPLDRINQKAIAIFDIFAAHRTDSLLDKLKIHNIQPLFVPAACTDKLQPLDVAVNYDYKELLKGEFHEWYSTQVLNSLNDDDDSGIAAQVDLKTSTLKPLHANLVINTHNRMSQRPELITSGFRKVGLLSD